VRINRDAMLIDALRSTASDSTDLDDGATTPAAATSEQVREEHDDDDGEQPCGHSRTLRGIGSGRGTALDLAKLRFDVVARDRA
jgi:hypothetical protein